MSPRGARFVRRRDERLLQVSVDFKAVVPRIGDHDVSVRGESQSLRPVQRVGRRVDVGQKGAAAIKHLADIRTEVFNGGYDLSALTGWPSLSS